MQVISTRHTLARPINQLRKCSVFTWGSISRGWLTCHTEIHNKHTCADGMTGHRILLMLHDTCPSLCTPYISSNLISITCLSTGSHILPTPCAMELELGWLPALKLDLALEASSWSHSWPSSSTHLFLSLGNQPTSISLDSRWLKPMNKKEDMQVVRYVNKRKRS